MQNLAAIVGNDELFIDRARQGSSLTAFKY